MLLPAAIRNRAANRRTTAATAAQPPQPSLRIFPCLCGPQAIAAAAARNAKGKKTSTTTTYSLDPAAVAHLVFQKEGWLLRNNCLQACHCCGSNTPNVRIWCLRRRWRLVTTSAVHYTVVRDPRRCVESSYPQQQLRFHGCRMTLALHTHTVVAGGGYTTLKVAADVGGCVRRRWIRRRRPHGRAKVQGNSSGDAGFAIRLAQGNNVVELDHSYTWWKVVPTRRVGSGAAGNSQQQRRLFWKKWRNPSSLAVGGTEPHERLNNIRILDTVASTLFWKTTESCTAE